MSVLRRMTALLGMATAALGMVLVAPSAQADTLTSQPHSIVTPDVGAAAWNPPISIAPGRNSCPTYYLCIWTGENFSGAGRGYTGNILPGQGVDWRGSVFENNVHSAVNQTTVRIMFLNYLGGGFYEEIGDLYPNGYDFPGGWSGATKADGMYYKG